MTSIQKQKKLMSLPNPHEVFDLIGGTGRGGLVALILGRLKMTIEQALNEYTALAKGVRETQYSWQGWKIQSEEYGECG